MKRLLCKIINSHYTEPFLLFLMSGILFFDIIRSVHIKNSMAEFELVKYPEISYYPHNPVMGAWYFQIIFVVFLFIAGLSYFKNN